MINHLISIDQYSKSKLENFFTLVNREQYGYTDSILVNKHQIATLFYEPSTRTSASFHSAATQLGYSVLPINEVTYSSVTKGETLEDTIRTIGSYVDLIVLRHGEKGAAQRAADVSTVPIINAGDGNGEYPTQTLLDLYTIWEKFGRITDLTITFVGDIENGRTVHSLDKALDNCTKYYADTFDKSIWPASDIYYLTRVQKERGSEGSYSMRKEHIKHIPNNAIVMHPFPRNEEIPRWFDDDPRAKYFEQMKNGLFVRMALLHEYL